MERAGANEMSAQAALTERTGASAGGALAWARGRFFALDLFFGAFTGGLLLWTLLSIPFPGLRLYPHAAEYQWAELGKWHLAGQFALYLGIWFALQPCGRRWHREGFAEGREAPAWLKLGNFAYTAAPAVLIPLVFQHLGAFLAEVSGVPAAASHPSWNPATVYDRAATWWDFTLKEVDLALFGVYPPLWARKLHRPWLVGLLQWCYASYYVAPLVAAVPAWASGQWKTLRHVTALVVGCLLFTYLGYVLMPATGPRFEGGFVEAWLPEQAGWLGAEWVARGLDHAEVIRWDAFPSGHTAVSILCLLIALRVRRKVGLVFLPFVVGLVAATVVLGYHYAIDVLVGLACVGFALAVIRPFVRWWEQPLVEPKHPQET